MCAVYRRLGGGEPRPDSSQGRNGDTNSTQCRSGGVGILLAEEWVDKVIEVVRVCDRIIKCSAES